MSQDSMVVIRRIIKEHHPKRLLELGSGKVSTHKIRSWLSRYNVDGYLTSLENDPIWYQNRLASSKFGEVIFAPLRDDAIMYEYELGGVYDLVFIDGPSMLIEKNHQQRIESECTKFGIKLRGSQSMHMLDYIWPHVTPDSFIVIDGRRASVQYYESTYKNKISVKHLGKSVKRSGYTTCSLIQKR